MGVKESFTAEKSRRVRDEVAKCGSFARGFVFAAPVAIALWSLIFFIVW